MSETSRHATCPHCGTDWPYEQYHAGFSNQGFMYCDSDETVVTWNTYDPVYVRLADKHPWMLDDAEKPRIEAALKPCPFGGHFAFANPPLCPVCNKNISAILPGDIYYVITGRHIDSETDEIWNAPAEVTI